VADISSQDQELLTTLVQRSLGLLSEVHEIEKRMRQLLADLTIAGMNLPKETIRPELADPVNRGPMRWTHRQ
jgi:hypothetical protein